MLCQLFVTATLTDQFKDQAKKIAKIDETLETLSPVTDKSTIESLQCCNTAAFEADDATKRRMKRFAKGVTAGEADHHEALDGFSCFRPAWT